MVGLIIFFLIVAIVAAIFGFGGIVAAATSFAIVVFWISVALLLIGLLVRLVAGPRRRY